MTRSFSINMLVAVFVILTVALEASCGGDAESPPPGDISEATTDGGNRREGRQGSGTFASLLSLIPDNQKTREIVYINDYARVREQFGIALPADNAGDQELRAYIKEVMGAEIGVGRDPWVSGFTAQMVGPVENRKYLAFDVRNVDQSIMAGPRPGILEVVKGRFDPGATDRSLERCSECPPPDRITHQEVEFYSWGEDFKGNLSIRLSPPAFDKLGRGGRIAVQDSYVYRTVETPGMRSLINTLLGREESLADDSDMILAAGEMDRLGVYSGLLMGGGVESMSIASARGDRCSSTTAPECEELMARLGAGVLGYYDVLGAGVGRDEDGAFIVVIFIYGSTRAAADDIQVFEGILGALNRVSPEWGSYVPNVEVRSNGRVLVAQLQTIHPTLWLDIVDPVNLLFLHR